MKRFIKPNLPDWTTRESVEYQFQNLLIFKDLDFVPNPIFFTERSLVMEFIPGDTIKRSMLQNGVTEKNGYFIIKQIKEKSKIIIFELDKIGRKYDLSYNNIMLKKDNQVVFVDFDYANKPKSLQEIIRVIEKLMFRKEKGRIK